MNRFTSSILVGFTVLMLAACSSTPTKDLKVKTQSAPNVNVEEYKSYTWLASARIVNDPAGQWEPPGFDADAEVKWLIDRELRKHGITEVAANPSMYIAFVGGVDMMALELKEDPKQKMEVLKNSPKAALVVIYIDAQTGQIIWAGAASGDVKEKHTSEDVKKRIDYVVTEMFKQLYGSKSSGGGYY